MCAPGAEYVPHVFMMRERVWDEMLSAVGFLWMVGWLIGDTSEIKYIWRASYLRVAIVRKYPRV